MRLFFIVVLLSIKTWSCFAQKPSELINSKILLVPFNPGFYINEGEYDMVKQTGKSYFDVMQIIRDESDRLMQKEFSRYSKVQSLNEEENASELINIYHAAGYYAAKAPDNDIDPRYVPQSHLSGTSNANQAKNTGDLVSAVQDYSGKFMNVRFEDNSVVPSLSSKYQVDYVVFINQFEVRGDFRDPYKIALRTYDLNLKLHFTIFDKQGKFIYGSYVSSDYPASVSDPFQISAMKFPELTNRIAGHIPGLKVTPIEPMQNDSIIVAINSSNNAAINHKNNSFKDSLLLNNKALYRKPSDSLNVVKAVPINEPQPIVDDMLPQNYYLITGSFKDPKNAENLKLQLIGLGFPSEVLTDTGGLYRVSVKTLHNRADAVRSIMEIKSQYSQLNMWILAK